MSSIFPKGLLLAGLLLHERHHQGEPKPGTTILPASSSASHWIWSKSTLQLPLNFTVSSHPSSASALFQITTVSCLGRAGSGITFSISFFSSFVEI